MLTRIPWKRLARAAAALGTAFTLGAGAATYAVLTHGQQLGEPLIVVGGKLVSASEPVLVQELVTVLPLPGELDYPTPTPVRQQARAKGDRIVRR